MATSRADQAAGSLICVVIVAFCYCRNAAAASEDALTLLGSNSTCTAVTNRGTLDLGRLSVAASRTLFAAADEFNSSYYLWSPCVDYDINAASQYKVSSESLPNCRAFAVAQYDSFTKDCVLVGSHSSSKYYVSGDHLVLTYKHGMYSVNISLLCGSGGNDSWTRLSNDLFNLAFELRSRELCFPGYNDGAAKDSDLTQKVLSLLRRLPGYGTLVLFAVAVTAVLYVLFGTAYTKLRYKRAMLDSLPNASFWRELPLLVRDGALFTVCRYKKRHNYSKINQLDRGDGEESDSSSSEDEYHYAIKTKKPVPRFKAYDSSTAAAAYSKDRTNAESNGHERVALLHKPQDDDDGARADPVDV